MRTAEIYVQAFIAVLVLVDPFSRSVFFRVLTEHEPERRREYVRRIMIAVAITLGVSALVGRQLLDLIGISLGAFGVAGGIVLTLMGFEMLLGGEPSRIQGGAESREDPQPISAEQSILVPYAIPFMAGPGAITAVITIASAGPGYTGVWAALVAVGLVVLLIPVGHLWLVNRMNFSEQGMSLATKFGGLLVATIGIQLILGGIRTFYMTS